MKKNVELEERNKDLAKEVRVREEEIDHIRSTKELNNIDPEEISAIEEFRKEKEEIESVITELISENNELKFTVSELEETLDKSKEEFKNTVSDLKKRLKDVNKYYEQPASRLSFRKKKDFIRLENELRQKNNYIDSLLDKIRGKGNSRAELPKYTTDKKMPKNVKKTFQKVNFF